MSEELTVEGVPTDDQKDRLEDFLAELRFITGKYQILLVDSDDSVQIRDVTTGHLIGLGLVRLAGAYLPVDSILDGAWMVDSVNGPVEQHRVMNVYPRREPAP